MSKNLRLAIVTLFTVMIVFTIGRTAIRHIRVSYELGLERPEPVECQGEPILVDLPYGGGSLKPWSCKEKCEEGKMFYLLYSNDEATQCGEPPDCFDRGEDDGITCIPPVESVEEEEEISQP